MSNTRRELSGLLSGPSTSSKSTLIGRGDALDSSSMWRKQPTEIQKPGNSSRPNSVFNPYDPPGRGKGANPVRGRVLVQPLDHSARPAKRPRMSSEFKHPKSSGGSAMKSSYFLHGSMHGPNPLPDEEILDFDEGENVAHSTSFMSEKSADELNIRTGHAFETDDIRMLDGLDLGTNSGQTSRSSKNERALPADGLSTQRLRERTQKQTGVSYVDIPDSDDIEEVDPPKDSTPPRQKRKRHPTPNGETSFKGVSVSQKRQQFEQLREQEPQAGPSKLTVKHVDFMDSSRIKNMKGKKTVARAGDVQAKRNGTTGSLKFPGVDIYKLKDPIATSSTQFVDADLPLERWIWGDDYFTDTSTSDIFYCIRLCKRATQLELFKRVGQSEMHVQRKLDLASLRNYTMVASAVNPGTGQFDALVHFEPKTSKHAPVTLKFSIECRSQDYKALLTILHQKLLHEKDCSTLTGPNIQSCWDSAWMAVKPVPIPLGRRSPDLDVIETVPPPMTSAEGVKTRRRGNVSASASSSTSGKLPQVYASQPRRSSRHSEAAKPKEPSLNPDELILVYPFTGPGAVNVTNGDLSRLEPQQFLNDTLIELWLKLMMHDLRERDPVLADEVHVFSSFFYKKLDPKKFEKGYESLRKWTARIDLFNKKYIIIPINENVHWYLAIIYRPEYILLPPSPKSPPNPPPSTRHSRRSSQPQASTSDTVGGGDLSTAEDKPASTKKEVAPTSDDDDPIEDADQFEDVVSVPDQPPVTVNSDGDGDEDMVSVTQRTHDFSIASLEDDMSEEQEILGLVEGGGRRPPDDDDETIPDSEPEPEPEQHSDPIPYSSPLTHIEDEEVDQLKDDNEDDVIVVDSEEFAREPSPVASSMDVDPNEVQENADVTSPSTRTSVDREASATSEEQQNTDGAIAANSFYSRSRTLQPFPMDVHKEREDDNSSSKSANSSPDKKEIDDEEVVIEDNDKCIDLTSDVLDDKTTYIFTLDSLGSKHPQAHRLIGEYLKCEAKDKKDLDDVNPAKGKLVDVPTQPNYCDCGLYLLHFAETFLADPETLATMVLQPKGKKTTAKQRTKLWKGEHVESMRKRMRERIELESARWKAFRAEKQKEEEEKRKEAGGQSVPQEESDDDDIIVGEIRMAKSSPKKPQKGRKSVANVPIPRASAPSRLRG